MRRVWPTCGPPLADLLGHLGDRREGAAALGEHLGQRRRADDVVRRLDVDAREVVRLLEVGGHAAIPPRCSTGGSGAESARCSSLVDLAPRVRSRGPGHCRPRCGRRSRHRSSRGRWCARCGWRPAWRRRSAAATATGSQRVGVARRCVLGDHRDALGRVRVARPPSASGAGTARSDAQRIIGSTARSRRTISRQATSQATRTPTGTSIHTPAEDAGRGEDRRRRRSRPG